MADRQRQRLVNRVNAHATQEAEQTREAIIAELQPLTSLVNGSEANNREERIKACCNQIALLQAANHEDWEAIRQERVAAWEAKANAKAIAQDAADYKSMEDQRGLRIDAHPFLSCPLVCFLLLGSFTRGRR